MRLWTNWAVTNRLLLCLLLLCLLLVPLVHILLAGSLRQKSAAGGARIRFPNRHASLATSTLVIGSASKPFTTKDGGSSSSSMSGLNSSSAAAAAVVTSAAVKVSGSPRARPTVVVLIWTAFWGLSFENEMQHTFLPSWPCSRFCELTFDHGRVRQADAVLFHAADFQAPSSPSYRSASQLWVFFNLEPPPFKFVTGRHDNVFNVTMTYRNDSDLPVGYGHFSVATGNRSLPDPIVANYEKRKPYAYWMAGNCASHRMDYVQELSKYINVDIFGKCGRGSRQCRGAECELELSSTHVFYLAFENALCPDYVTEKLWRTLASRGGAIPVVIGAPLSYYEALAPPDSFIHAENFTSVRELGAFLNKVASSRDAFLFYHSWRTRYEAHEGWNHELARGVCRLCESLHNGELLTAPIKTELSGWANAGCRAQWPR